MKEKNYTSMYVFYILRYNISTVWLRNLVHRDTKEALTHDALSENPVIMAQCVDANLYHGILTDRSIINTVT